MHVFVLASSRVSLSAARVDGVGWVGVIMFIQI